MAPPQAGQGRLPVAAHGHELGERLDARGADRLGEGDPGPVRGREPSAREAQGARIPAGEAPALPGRGPRQRIADLPAAQRQGAHQAGGRARPAGDAGRRQGGVAEPDRHPLHRHARARRPRPCASSVVMPLPISWCAQDTSADAVRAEPDPHRRGGDLDRPHRGRAAEAHPPGSVTHCASRIEPGRGTRRDQPKARAPASKQAISGRVENGLPETGSTAVSLSRRSAIGSMVSADGHLVDGALQGEQERHLRGRPHRPRRVAVDAHGPLLGPDVRAGVEARRDLGALHDEGVEPRRHGLGLVHQGGEPARPRRRRAGGGGAIPAGNWRW